MMRLGTPNRDTIPLTSLIAASAVIDRTGSTSIHLVNLDTPRNMLHLDAVEALLELAHLVQVRSNLWAPVLLCYLLDDQL